MTDKIDMIAMRDQTYLGVPVKAGASFRVGRGESRVLLALKRARFATADDGEAGTYETRVMTAPEPRATRTYKRRDLSAK